MHKSKLQVCYLLCNAWYLFHSLHGEILKKTKWLWQYPSIVSTSPSHSDFYLWPYLKNQFLCHIEIYRIEQFNASSISDLQKPLKHLTNFLVIKVSITNCIRCAVDWEPHFGDNIWVVNCDIKTEFSISVWISWSLLVLGRHCIPAVKISVTMQQFHVRFTCDWS